MIQTVHAIANRYVRTRPLSLMHAQIFCSRVGKLSDFVKSDAAEDCFTEDAVNRFLGRYSTSHAPHTVKGMRGDLLTAWRHCADLGLVPMPDSRAIRIRKPPQSIPDCYTVAEVRQLIADCRFLKGSYGETSRELYMSTLIRLGWETGLRLGDCWQITSDQLRGDKLVRVSAKSGLRTVHELSQPLQDGIRQLGNLGWKLSRASFPHHFRTVRDVSVGRGSFKWLRRSSGSYVAAQYGEAAGASHLGHSNLATFRRYYDSRLVEGHRPHPPILD